MKTQVTCLNKQLLQHPWDEWLNANPTMVYKQDRRSKVWRVDVNLPAGSVAWVIKRFDHHPLRQRLACLLGLHPGQKEIRQAQRMIADGLPVLAVEGAHIQPQGLGCRFHLATRYHGVSLQQARKQQLIPDDQKQALLIRIGAMVASLLERGWVFRDLKTANILLDDDWQPLLIDVGSARRGAPIRSSQAGLRVWRMLRMLDHTLTLDGWSVEDRRSCLARPLACISPEPVSHAYDRLAAIVLK